jgi:hypothetical protein
MRARAKYLDGFLIAHAVQYAAVSIGG